VSTVDLHPFFLTSNLFSGGRTIIFTETKDSASELAGLIPLARALHGDVVQAQREVSDSSSAMIY
jgi:superfamily II DNA/RNA helicase